MLDSTAGHDTPSTKDELGREQFARQIYTTLIALPPDWSVRVGLFGSWGSGKTSIAEWIGRWADSDNHVSVTFKVGAEDKDTLWHNLGSALAQALSDHDVEIGAITEVARKSRKAGQAVLEKASRIIPNATIYGVGIGGSLLKGISDAMRFKATDVRGFQTKLNPGQRVIVIIDDLDRLEPAILARTLLAVRDILDLPGYSFLLPFDDHAIRESLEKYITGAGAGEGFLEKIIDFRFRIPELSLQQRKTFLLGILATTATFVPNSAVDIVVGMLPTTPRRLKSIARHISLLSSVAARHTAEELNWPAILFYTTLRQEHETFATLFRDRVIADTENPYAAIMEKPEQRAQRREAVLGELLTRSNAPASEQDRLRLLARFYWDTLLRPGQKWVERSIQTVDSSPLMTQSELAYILLQLDGKLKIETVERLFRSQRISLAEGLSHIANALGARYSQNLNTLADAFRKRDLDAATKDAFSTISFFDQLSRLGSKIPEPAHLHLFSALYQNAVMYQILAPTRLERMEISIIQRLVRYSTDGEIRSITSQIGDDTEFEPKELPRRTKLACAAMQACTPRVVLHLLKMFSAPDFLQAFQDFEYRSEYLKLYPLAPSRLQSCKPTPGLLPTA